jgi:hypothetical protein
LEKEQEIVDQIEQTNQTIAFNQSRTSDTLLRRFYEVDGLLEFEDLAKKLLGQILSDDRKIFYAKTIDNMSGRELDHEWALSKKLEAKYKNMNYLISDLFFRSIDMMPLEEIDFRFEIRTDLGDLMINLHHKLIDCDKLSRTYGDNVPEYLKDRTKRIDPCTKMSIRCRIIESKVNQ